MRSEHGMYGTPTHNTWRTMIERCTKPYHKSYESPRGAEFTYYDGDQDTVDNLEEAEEGGYHPVIVVYP